jgi:hypothetical protein
LNSVGFSQADSSDEKQDAERAVMIPQPKHPERNGAGQSGVRIILPGNILLK